MLSDELARGLEGLTAEELRCVISELQEMVARALAAPVAEPTACPRCGCTHFAGDGVDKRREGGRVVETTQRYECRGCGRTFTRKTGALLSLTKLPAEKWVRFAEPGCLGSSLRDSARDLGLPDPTVHYMRVRLYEVAGAAVPGVSCGPGDGCQADGTYLNESMKALGSRGGAEMPRAAHRTGHDVRSRGVSNEKVCVMVVADDSGAVAARVCDRGRPTDAAVRASLEGSLGAGCAVSTDDHRAYSRVLPGLGVPAHLTFPSDGSAGDGLWRVNAAHQRLRGFLSRYHGVSTRYLAYYLRFFCFTEHVRRCGRDKLAAMQDAVARGHHQVRRDELYGSRRPFWDWWERPAA